MFKLPNFRRKKNQTTVVEIQRPHSVSSGRFSVSDAPADKSSAENRTGGKPCWYRLFGRPVNKERGEESGQRCGPQQSRVPSSDDPASTTTAGYLKAEKSRWRCRAFDCCRNKRRVTPAAQDEGERKTPQKAHRSPVKATDQTLYAPDELDEVVQFQAPAKEEEDAAEKDPETEKKDELAILTALVVEAVSQTLAKQDSSSSSAKTHHVHLSDVTRDISFQSLGGQQDWLGFPNPAQNCYMNSSLQSLITLAHFIRDVSSQEEVWSSVPEAEVIRRFMDVVRCQHSVDRSLKLRALDLFKRALSVQAPEFQDHHQKDAHEFLTTVLDQIRSFSPLLQEVAASVGKTYRCPVDDHLVFKMQNTRTCKRCGAQSEREEDFTNLSLHLVPGGSVQDMLQDYLMETELDFRCDCGANTSGQQSTFVTLPKVLMLHVKRFCFTPFLQLKKLSDPVHLFRELLVTSSQADGWYSLVSVISHLGSGGNRGHYMSDGLHPDVELDDPADRWLSFNDSEVTETTGASVCERRQRTAYILFYQRRV